MITTIFTIFNTLLILFLFLYLYKNRSSSPILSSSPIKRGRKVILDSCALIDGRILELVSSGFVPDLVIVPSFIVRELQQLADGRDPHKRERARFGLDLIKKLQKSETCELILDQTDFPNIPEIDDRLVELAKKTSAMLYTTDFNLNKVASIEGVVVLNVNELAQNLRTLALPGEQINIKLVQKGSNPSQAVGYLEDGTMVVVDKASRMLGQTKLVEVSRVHQTVAGKMIFANLLQKQKRQ